MELFNINDNIRVIIYENIEKLKKEGNSLEESIGIFRDCLYSYLDEEQDINKELLEMIVKVSYADTIKLLVYRIKNGIAKDEDKVYFENLKEIDDYNSLCAEISANPDIFEYILGTCYEFCNINYFGRINIINKLSNVENRWIFNISNMHSMDFMTYKNVGLEDIINHINDEIAYQDKNFSTSMSESNVIGIIGCINSIIQSNEKRGINLLFEIGVVDYSVSKFLSNELPNNDLLLTRVDLYENYSVDDILDHLKYNEEFLRQAVWMVYSLYFDKAYGQIELDESILNNDGTKQMKKKLVLN